MKIKKIIEKIDEYAPPTDFEKSIFFGTEKEELSGMCVCIDPTIDVMKVAKEKNIDMIISHHYPTERSAKFAAENGIYAMTVHLRQDIAQGGNIDSLAEIAGLENVEPFTIKYKGMVVPNGAVTGNFGHILGYLSGQRLQKNIGEIAVRLDNKLREFGLNPHLKIFDPNEMYPVTKVGLSAGAAIKPEFLEQISKKGIDVYIASEMEQSAIMVANELNIKLIDIGHYESEFPGMKKLAEKLNAEFIPNDYVFGGN